MPRPNVATGFTRGWETFANWWAMFQASVLRQLAVAGLIAIGVACLWSLWDLGPLVKILPGYLQASTRSEIFEVYRAAFDGRTRGFLFRYGLARALVVFSVLLPAFVFGMTVHGRRLLSGDRRRGSRLTTLTAEARKRWRIRLLASVAFGVLVGIVVAGVEISGWGMATFLDYLRSGLVIGVDGAGWLFSSDGRGRDVFIDGALRPGFYDAMAVHRYLRAEVFGASLSGIVGRWVAVCVLAGAAGFGWSFLWARNKDRALDPYRIAGCPVPAAALTQHVLVCGSPGSGKSVAIQALLDQVRARALPAVVYDTGEYVALFYREGRDVLFNPADARSVAWTPFAEIETEADAKAIAKSLFAPSSQNPFWEEAAATVLAAVLWKLKGEGATTNRALYERFARCDQAALHLYLSGTQAASYMDPAARAMGAGVLSTLMNQLAPFAMMPDPPRGQVGFSIRNLIRHGHEELEGAPGGDRWFFFGTTELHAQVLRPIVSLMASIAARTYLDMPLAPKPRHWLFLDEVASLQRLSVLQDVLARVRKRGLAVVLGLQSLAQLRELYGRDGAAALLEQPQTWLVLRTVGLGAEDLAGLVGQEEIEVQQESISMGASSVRDGINLSMHTQMRPLVLPSEVATFPSCTGLLRLPGAPLIYRVAYTPESRTALAPQLVPVGEN